MKGPLAPLPADSQVRPPSSGDRSLAGQIVTATACRVILNTGRRFAYPFAPALSRGMNVPLTAITSLIAVMQVTGILGILGGPLADRWGYRKVMLAATAMMAVGMVVVWAAPYYWVVMVGLFVAGLSKTLFDPAIYGYTGRRVPFSQRGRVIGVLEFAWAGSALIGIPLVGLSIASMGWQAPFWMLGACALVGMGFILYLFPRDANVGERANLESWRVAWARLVKERQAIGLMGFAFWASLGNDQLFVVYGAWMELSFGMGVAAIGLGTGIIGAAELIGEVLTAIIGDRMGLKRAAMLGAVVAAVAYGLLPLFNAGPSIALSGLFLIFLVFEFSMVCGISLSTEALPQYRATMVAAYLGVGGMGRIIGSLVGGPVWLAGGIDAVGAVSATASALSAGCLLWGMGLRSR